MRFAKRILPSVLVTLMLNACNVPPHVIPDVTSYDRDVYGAWTEVNYPRASHRQTTYGELIAVTPDELTILTTAGAVTVRRADAEEVAASLFSPGARISGYVAAGIVSSISHGYFLVLSIPLWSLTAVSANRQFDRFAEISYPKVAWEELRRGARFPQGVPEGFDVRSLRPRPTK